MIDASVCSTAVQLRLITVRANFTLLTLRSRLGSGTRCAVSHQRKYNSVWCVCVCFKYVCVVAAVAGQRGEAQGSGVR